MAPSFFYAQYDIAHSLSLQVLLAYNISQLGTLTQGLWIVYKSKKNNNSTDADWIASNWALLNTLFSESRQYT